MCRSFHVSDSRYIHVSENRYTSMFHQWWFDSCSYKKLLVVAINSFHTNAAYTLLCESMASCRRQPMHRQSLHSDLNLHMISPHPSIADAANSFRSPACGWHWQLCFRFIIAPHMQILPKQVHWPHVSCTQLAAVATCLQSFRESLALLLTSLSCSQVLNSPCHLATLHSNATQETKAR